MIKLFLRIWLGLMSLSALSCTPFFASITYPDKIQTNTEIPKRQTGPFLFKVGSYSQHSLLPERVTSCSILAELTLPKGLSLDYDSGDSHCRLRGTPHIPSEASPFTAVVMDEDGSTFHVLFSIEVAEVNSKTITTFSDRLEYHKETYLVTPGKIEIHPVVNNIKDLQLIPRNLPKGLSFDANNGVIQGVLEQPLNGMHRYRVEYTEIDTGQHRYTQFNLAAGTITDVAVGPRGSGICGIINDAIACWSKRGPRGEESQNHTNFLTTPAKAVQISISGAFGCSVLENGHLYCWGSNSNGALGLGPDITFANSPQRVGGDLLTKIVRQVSVNLEHSCATTADNDLYCWGSNGNNRLGLDDASQPRYSPAKVEPLAAGAHFVSTGEAHTCVIKTDQSLWCWGSGGDGRLGRGSSTHSATPIQVHSPDGSGFLAGIRLVEAGVRHTCAATLAEMYCWGSGGHGQLGNNTTTSASRPVLVSGVESPIAITTAMLATCASTATQTLCWGANSVGELGNGTTDASLVPTPVSSELNFVKLTGGGWSNPRHNNHLCGLTASGRLQCWGSNTEIITSFFQSSQSPFKPNATLSQARDFHIGRTSYVIRNNKVYALGVSDYGQMGPDNTLTVRSNLLELSTGFPLDLTPRKIAWGFYAACFIYDLISVADSELWCVGYNLSGLRGDGTFGGGSTPSKALLNQIKDADIGTHHSCILRNDDSVWCAGKHSTGSIGPNSVGNSSSFVHVMDNVKSLQLQQDASCVITLEGEIWCWGTPLSGNFGAGILSPSSTPIKASGFDEGERVLKLSMRSRISCALTDRQNIYCAGLGVNYLAQQVKPERIHSVEDVVPSFMKIPLNRPANDLLVIDHQSICIIDSKNDLSCLGALRNGLIGSKRYRYVVDWTAVPSAHKWKEFVSVRSNPICAKNTVNQTYCWMLDQDVESFSSESDLLRNLSPRDISAF
jgi:alpha-tubulin suppressor-like RCC1 family protein